MTKPQFSFMALLRWSLIFVGCSILLINAYGLTQSLRPEVFETEHLRFGENDISLSLAQYREAVKRLPHESDSDYSRRLTEVIAQGTAHIHWERYEPSKFNQRVPLWENWILHLMGRFSGIPEFERYHFVDIDKSIERGIGICGEVSMLMTSLLEKNGIEAEILTFPGHVVVQAEVDGETTIFDPDFGVVVPYTFATVSDNLDSASQRYVDAGYTQGDKQFFEKSFASPLKVWRGPEHFITKKYYFEKLSYWLIWLIPLACLAGAWIVRKRS